MLTPVDNAAALLRILFNTSLASLYKLPFQDSYKKHPEKVDIKNINEKVWQGTVRLLEESGESSTTPRSISISSSKQQDKILAFTSLRLKIEFINIINFVSEKFWGEVWYIPTNKKSSKDKIEEKQNGAAKSVDDKNRVRIQRIKKIAHDGRSTIIPIEGERSWFRVIVQIPDSGFFPVFEDEEEEEEDNEDEEDGKLSKMHKHKQVALLLKLNLEYQAEKFRFRIETFDSEYEAEKDRYLRAELKKRAKYTGVDDLLPKPKGLTGNKITKINKEDESENEAENAEDAEDEGEEDFGDFVSTE
ncbi:predicted protein [Lodderomyces elongisporus NRRL YB-4239]|uniref:Uncharacterized protein n=1 Tax=Lodderomyces elongisporus (strain ATCC 11503 / CBS 2605 / JCM 1781 / NBRC 1676 / NRRL YB-4239) TaxID=379508 RepID=A5DRY3_LODEL|nr:predicted protein [Lodderomyces elongisporus NRRL YB-4239]